MDPAQPLFVPDPFGGHWVTVGAIVPASATLYFTALGQRAAATVELDLWHQIHILGLVDLSRARLEILYFIEIQRLVLVEMVRLVNSDTFYFPLEAQIVQAHLAQLEVPPPVVPAIEDDNDVDVVLASISEEDGLGWDDFAVDLEEALALEPALPEADVPGPASLMTSHSCNFGAGPSHVQRLHQADSLDLLMATYGDD